MNLGLGARRGVQLLEGFGKGQPGIGADGKGQSPVAGQVDQILLIRQQHSPNSTVGQRRSEGVALLQKAELVGLASSSDAAPRSTGSWLSSLECRVASPLCRTLIRVLKRMAEQSCGRIVVELRWRSLSTRPSRCTITGDSPGCGTGTVPAPSGRCHCPVSRVRDRVLTVGANQVHGLIGVEVAVNRLMPTSSNEAPAPQGRGRRPDRAGVLPCAAEHGPASCGGCRGLGTGMKHRSAPSTAQQPVQSFRVATIGQMHRDAAGRGNACCSQLGGHAAGSPATTISSACFQGLELAGMDI